MYFLLWFHIKVDHEIESYNFFTKVWEPSPSRPQEVQEQILESSGIFLFYLFIRILSNKIINSPFIICVDAEIDVTNDENKKLITEDYLGLTDGEDIDVLDYSVVPSLDTSLKIKEAAEKIYFIPERSPGMCMLYTQ